MRATAGGASRLPQPRRRRYPPPPFHTKDVSSVIERDVLIPMPGGHCDAALFSAGTGPCPGVLLWTDALGLRPAKRAMARRLAEAGYTVLVPNPYYRIGPAPFFDPATFSFSTRGMSFATSASAVASPTGTATEIAMQRSPAEP